MSKAVEWFKSRNNKSKGDKGKSSGRKSPSHGGEVGKSGREHVDDRKSESDASSISSELENPFRGRLSPFREVKSRSSEFQRPQQEEWRAQAILKSRSDEFGWPPQGTQVYREWQDRLASGNDDRPERGDFTFGDWKRHLRPNYGSREVEKSALGRNQPVDWASQVSLSSTSTGGTSSGEYERRPIERPIMEEQEGEKGMDRRRSLDWNSRSYAYEADKKQASLPRVKEAEFDTFNFLLQNWPKLRSSSSDKRRFEARLMNLFEVETEIIVIGERPTTERWSLGIVDEGIKALGRAILSRGYPSLKTLSFTQCRMLLESPFATLAKAINTSNVPKLEEIIFEHNHYINNQGFLELARAFKTGGHFSRLTTLVLMDNGMQDEGLSALARDAFGSGNLSNLKKLHIGSYNIEDTNHEQFHLDAARELAKELSSSGHLPQLEDLRFRGCVNCRGVVSVVESLETRTEGAVKSLDLRHSPLETEGIRVLARAFEAPQFSSLVYLDLSINTEEWPVLLESFQLSNLCSLQRIVLSSISVGEQELFGLAALLEARHLPGLQEFNAHCIENTMDSALALVSAYERNRCLVAKLNIDLWPLEELQVECEKYRVSNMELDGLV